MPLFVYISFHWCKLVACCPNKCSWSVGPVGIVWIIFRLDGFLKVGKLDESSEGKIGKFILFVLRLYKWIRRIVCGMKVHLLSFLLLN
jgi:hypothetical protein